MKEKAIELFTDGACKGKTKKGGYAAYLPHKETVICGTENNTTNNKMELQAVISGLKAIEAHIERIEVYTDSQYVCNGANKWMNNWKRNGWKTREGEDVKNKDKKINILPIPIACKQIPEEIIHLFDMISIVLKIVQHDMLIL